jgi:hypothetical protein
MLGRRRAFGMPRQAAWSATHGSRHPPHGETSTGSFGCPFLFASHESGRTRSSSRIHVAAARVFTTGVCFDRRRDHSRRYRHAIRHNAWQDGPLIQEFDR